MIGSTANIAQDYNRLQLGRGDKVTTAAYYRLAPFIPTLRPHRLVLDLTHNRCNYAFRQAVTPVSASQNASAA
jgi:hypothetical protein